MNLDGSNYSVLVDSTTNSGIHAVDYHLRINKLFWTHYRDGTIHQANMDGSLPIEIFSNVTRPSGLAVDWINNRVYYSFGDFGSLTVNPNHLAVYDMSTGTTTEITAVIDQTHAVFHDIAIDPLQ
ncbi:Low-density lipoprotein receptor-related protein 2, partial [Geodia barretti]